MRLRQVSVGPMRNFAYLLADDEGEGLLVDPAWDVPLLLKEAEAAGIRIRAILATHGHHDHVLRLSMTQNGVALSTVV